MDFRIFTEPQQGATYDDLLRVAQETERLNFNGFFRSDHYLSMGSVSGAPGPTDSWITLAGLARANTTRIRLGTLMTAATFRHPAPLAVAVAQVDAMSGGRIEFGFGTGWYEAEHRSFGIAFPAIPRERMDRFEEQLQIVLGMWATPIGERFSFHGTYFDIADNPALTKPAQHPRLPVIIGGSGLKRTPRLAAQYADEFNSAFKIPTETSEYFDRVRQSCETIDRDPSSLVMSAAQALCIGESEAEISRRASQIGRDPQELRENGLGGSVDEVIEKIERFKQLGAARLYLQVLDLSDLDHLRLFAEQVLPAVT